ncbi:hypothetical protein D3C85_873000 [compost metagenome]
MHLEGQQQEKARRAQGRQQRGPTRAGQRQHIVGLRLRGAGDQRGALPRRGIGQEVAPFGHVARQPGLVPQGFARGYEGNAAQAVAPVGQPFQRARVPHVAHALAAARPEVARQVPQKHQHPRRDQVGTHRGHHVQQPPSLAFGIGVDAPGHAGETGEMHGKERHVKAHEHQPERPAAQPFRQGAPADQGRPVIERREQRKHHAAEQDVMQVRHDEVGIVRLQVEGNHGHHHAGQPAQHKDEEEAKNEQHGRLQRAQAHRRRDGGDPGEHLDGGGHRHRHAGRRCEAQRQRRNTGGEHVMDPQAKAQERGAHHRHHHQAVTHQRHARHGRNDHGHHAGRRQEDDVDLGVAEEPEQVLPQQGVAAALGDEERHVEGALQFQQGGGDDDGGKRNDDHAAEHQHDPGEYRHFVQRHTGRAGAQDADRKLDGASNGRDFDEADAQQPQVGIHGG